MASQFVSSSDIRAQFSQRMSNMYRAEVPAYGDLLNLVSEINAESISKNTSLVDSLESSNGLERVSQERHGAIRLGTPNELNIICRIFKIMGMFPVGYYDLAAAGIPVHSTAFRPINAESLAVNPFRMFTSLLRLDLIEDQDLVSQASKILHQRQIFSNDALDLLDKAESVGGLSETESSDFINAVVETFRWQQEANVTLETYEKLHEAHRLVADIVCFKGPHINHLTPRTLDIDLAHESMKRYGIVPKETIEGPPQRQCPILLRQTSFKAIEEAVLFTDDKGGGVEGFHTARFGEIEQRGIALTPKGKGLYDRLLNNSKHQDVSLAEAFSGFPDSWHEIREQELAYFHYSWVDGTEPPKMLAGSSTVIPDNQHAVIPDNDPGSQQINRKELDNLINDGVIRFDPIIYEDFLPVSAAGIFKSNLGESANQTFGSVSNRDEFEEALGEKVLDPFQLYQAIEDETIKSL